MSQNPSRQPNIHRGLIFGYKYINDDFNKIQKFQAFFADRKSLVNLDFDVRFS